MVTSVSTEKEKKRKNLFALILLRMTFSQLIFSLCADGQMIRRPAIVASVPVSIERNNNKLLLSFFLSLDFVFCLFVWRTATSVYSSTHSRFFLYYYPNLSYSPSSIHFGVLVFSLFVRVFFISIYFLKKYSNSRYKFNIHKFVCRNAFHHIHPGVCVSVYTAEEDICLFYFHFFSFRFPRIKKKTHL